MSDLQQNNDLQEKQTNGNFQLPNVTKKASSFGRFLWASVGVVGTLSGLLAFYQFFTEDSTKHSAPLTSEEMIVAMVKNQTITVEEATQLANVLIGESARANDNATEIKSQWLGCLFEITPCISLAEFSQQALWFLKSPLVTVNC